jgi:hypothetical protein
MPVGVIMIITTIMIAGIHHGATTIEEVMIGEMTIMTVSHHRERPAAVVPVQAQ